MNTTFQKINSLPVSTWGWLGVNGTDVPAEIPEIVPCKKENKIVRVPDSVKLFSGVLPVPELETALGTDAADFVQDHWNCGITAVVPAGTRPEQPIFLSYHMDESNPAIVDRNTLVAEEGSEVTVVMSYLSKEGVSGFHSGLTRLFAGKNAVIHLVQVQLLGDTCVNFDNIGAVTQENGAVDIVQVEFGAKSSYAGCKTRLLGKGSRMDYNTIYFGDQDRSLDMNVVAEHAGQKTNSEISASGALLDESSKIFRGTIDFLRGAKQAVGHESEYSLLFSPKVRSRTAPLILCGEENVEGQHAATTGKIDENKLFYLMSRGLDELAAKKLVIEAQFRPATEKIPDDALRRAVSEFVEKRLNKIESLSQ